MAQPETDKQRRQRHLDQLAFEILAARHTEWTRWTDWFELTKAKYGDRGLGPGTFSDCIKRLLDRGKIKQSQNAKNRFYGVIFTSGSSVGGVSPPDLVAPVPDKAVQALAFLLNKKPPGVV
jgi:hypothetical protein